MTDANQSDAVVVPEGWIKHDGGPCPVRRGQATQVLFRDGTVKLMSNTFGYGWRHMPHFMPKKDIIAYKPEPSAGGEKG